MNCNSLLRCARASSYRIQVCKGRGGGPLLTTRISAFTGGAVFVKHAMMGLIITFIDKIGKSLLTSNTEWCKNIPARLREWLAAILLHSRCSLGAGNRTFCCHCQNLFLPNPVNRSLSRDLILIEMIGIIGFPGHSLFGTLSRGNYKYESDCVALR